MNTQALPIERLLRPFAHFIHVESSGGIVLILCTAVALAWANLAPEGYIAAWQTHFSISVGPAGLSKPLLLWINDALMAAFFFLVGLEIKREVLVGELSSVRQAALPVAAAVGGMIAPAIVYAVVNHGTPSADGWGVPMATDIAFALGILSMLGDRVPAVLKVFLAAVAIVDDIGAILIIAAFYTSSIALLPLAVGGALFLILMLMNRLGVRSALPYILVGALLWLAILKSGIHATVAGVLVALCIPARPRIGAPAFIGKIEKGLRDFSGTLESIDCVLTNRRQKAALAQLAAACEKAETPLQRIEHTLHPWVAFAVIPLFALANAGVDLSGGAENAFSPASIGIFLGLVFGKQVGIMSFAWLQTRLSGGRLPHGVGWRHLYGAAWLSGIGFTMSIFVAALAFGEGSVLLEQSKASILAASFASALGGWLILRRGSGT